MSRLTSVAVALVAVLAACSSHATLGAGASTVSTSAVVVPSAAAPSSSASSSSSVTLGSPTTGTAPPLATVAPSTSAGSPLTTAGTAPPVGTTRVLDVPPPSTTLDRSPSPDDAAMFAVYRATWAGYVWTASHPDDPRWGWIDETIEESNRPAWRKDIEDHWSRGEILNATGGLTVNPHVFDRQQSTVRLFDCQSSGIFWANSATGEPAAGESRTVRLRGWYVVMFRSGSTWATAVADEENTSRRQSECGA